MPATITRPSPSSAKSKPMLPTSSEKENIPSDQRQIDPSTAKIRFPGSGTQEDGEEDMRPGKGTPYLSRCPATMSNQMPFSRSAAKRESVMALGSIGHLQHFYAKQGFASKIRPMTRGHLTLAIGHAGESALRNHVEPPTSQGTEDAMAMLEGGRGSRQVTSLAEGVDEESLGPEASTYSLPPYPNVPKPVEADPEAQRPLVAEHLDRTCQLWGLLDLLKADTESMSPQFERRGSHGSLFPTAAPLSRTMSESSEGGSSAPLASASVDLVHLMTSTTKTIRSVRNYLLALPPDAISTSAVPHTPGEPKRKDAFKRQSSFASLPRASGVPSFAASGEKYGSLSRKERPNNGGGASGGRAMPSAWQSPKLSDGGDTVVRRGPDATHAVEEEKTDDPLTLVRSAALNVLGMLKELEEEHRLPQDHPAYKDQDGDRRTKVNAAVETLSEPDSPCVGSFQADEMRRGSMHTSDTSVDEIKPEYGHLYRSDLKLSDLEKERVVVREYLGTVDRILSAVKGVKKAHISNRRRLSGNPEAVSPVQGASPGQAPMIRVDSEGSTGLDEDLPSWADPFHPNGELGRIRDLLTSHLPVDLALDLIRSSTPDVSASKDPLSVPPIDREGLLEALADGQMLCLAYNEVLRNSRRPWGFIQSKEIHDLKLEARLWEEREAEERDKKKVERQEPFKLKGQRPNGGEREGPSQAGKVVTPKSDKEPETGEASGKSPSRRPRWTFRRTENLRVWAAALKLRYHINTSVSNTLESRPLMVAKGGSSSSNSRRAVSESLTHPSRRAMVGMTIDSASNSSIGLLDIYGGGGFDEANNLKNGGFDARLIARKTEGWQDMVFNLVLKWLEAVVQEESGSQESEKPGL
ncbi:hypothetical protein IE53DRAFT_367470 [Violaceomyces palustris]|uniref:Uncharacterized protein n=1 Tax=Violaceomyces palustris TaxID=1673888 RepID=A0ACD0P1Z4_9BASI|nr:hypothetical protein IE53DRAFT_367470 [Violaceomyces palustris]